MSKQAIETIKNRMTHEEIVSLCGFMLTYSSLFEKMNGKKLGYIIPPAYRKRFSLTELSTIINLYEL